jgi:apolipoprotein N-acyltransferase
VAEDRTFSAVLQDILRNLQEIIRSEVRLAKVEIRDEAVQAGSSALWITAGAVGALCSWMLLSWTAVYALAMVMSMWAATLVVAVALASMASVLLVVGLRRFKRIQPIPEHTVETLKENLEWMKQSTK